MNILGRPPLRPIDRVRHRLWAANLLAMAKAAEKERRAPPAPLQAKLFRANPFWLERAMRADNNGKPMPSGERPQAFTGVLLFGADPTQCYERVTPRAFKGQGRTSDSSLTPARRGPAKGQPYNRVAINLVDRGEALLPGSRRFFEADIWNLLQEMPRTLYDTHLAVQKLLQQLGRVRIHHAQVKAVGDQRLAQLRGSLPPVDYRSQLKQLEDDYPAFDIDVFSLLANLVHESYLMGNRELHEIHLNALGTHYGKLAALNIDDHVSDDLNSEIQRKIIDQDWWHAGYRHSFPPIDTSQLLLAKDDWDTLKHERPDLARTMGWLRITLPSPRRRP